MDLVDVAGELYGLAPEEFTPTRNERAKQARADGDKELATGVKQLRKPATAAWVVNMMVRRQADEMEQVLGLGESLRAAQEELDAESLRSLTRQRRQLTTAVTTQGRRLAYELGHKISDAVADQVEQTLHAAMIDEGAAAAVRSGLLLEPLSATGLGDLDVAGAVAVPAAIGLSPPRAQRAAKPSPVKDETRKEEAPQLSVVEDETRRLEEAREKAEEATQAAEKAQRKLDKAAKRVSRLEAKSLQLQGRLDELRRTVSEVEHELEGVEDDLEAVEDRRDRLERKRDKARVAVEKAQQELAKLESRSGPSGSAGP